ncbi:hypothetical protein ACK8P5_08130 [Paenibacillus sp. EC2-1]|uniref:hypothetical protein n=1 Tax=Paenibacillus sp. EC2-1 TaxID=3388665 RepID=UPI003BEEB2A2
MCVSKHLRDGVIRICTILLSVLLFSGCSIPSRNVEPENIKPMTSPVMIHVYERSVEKDVYSSDGRRGEKIIPEPSLETQDHLQDVVH